MGPVDTGLARHGFWGVESLGKLGRPRETPVVVLAVLFGALLGGAAASALCADPCDTRERRVVTGVREVRCD